MKDEKALSDVANANNIKKPNLTLKTILFFFWFIVGFAFFGCAAYRQFIEKYDISEVLILWFLGICAYFFTGISVYLSRKQFKERIKTLRILLILAAIGAFSFGGGWFYLGIIGIFISEKRSDILGSLLFAVLGLAIIGYGYFLIYVGTASKKILLKDHRIE